jgi:pimeloyl-ACP methyl ester carboxylesterase
MIKVLFALTALFGLGSAGCAPFQALQEREATGKSVSAPGGPVKLAVHESGKGPPVLLLHGLGTSSYTWRHIMPVLAKSHRVLAVDLRGFGASEKPLDDRYSIFDQADAIDAFIREQNLTDLTVVGHSFGGGVTLALALKMQNEGQRRIKKIVLVDSIAYRQPIPIFFQLLRAPVISDIGMALVPPEVQAEQALKIAFHDAEKVTPQAVNEYASPLYSPAAKHALRQTVEKLVPTDIDAFTARYKTLKVPAQLIWCENDKIVPLEYGKRLSQDLPNAELTVLSGCGHMPQEEKPEETAEAIRGFLAKNSRMPPAGKGKS